MEDAVTLRQGANGTGAADMGRLVMKNISRIMLLTALAVSPGFSAPVLFTGIFSQDNQVQLFTFNLSSPSVITVKTYSYAGAQIGPTTIPAGGFAPDAFLFDNIGGQIIASSGSCGQVGQDPVTSNCDDIFFQNSLGQGSYTFALSVDDNRPVSNFVSDGFVEDSNPGFTCGGGAGDFCDLSGVGQSRTGAWAITFTGTGFVTEVETPEPSSLILFAAGFGLFTLLRRWLLSQ